MTQICRNCQRPLELPGPVAFCPYCGRSLGGTAPAPSPALTPGLTPSPATAPSGELFAAPEQLGEYRLLRRLGQGGMGAVFEGEHQTTGRRVAVKVIDVRADEDAVVRFRQEGRLASALSHPRCVFIYAADQDQGRPFIVMELMPGQTLEDLVRQRGPLPAREAIQHTLDLIDGLMQVHALGVIHRDVKPSNCFLDATERVKVGDFGLARSLQQNARLTVTGAFVGTPLFASPEQIKAGPLDIRADVYSVCATLYFLLTARAPHDQGDGDSLATMARVITEDPPPLRSFRPKLPQGLERLVARGLSRDRDNRQPDLATLREELLSLTRNVSGWLILQRLCAYWLDVTFLAPVGWMAIWLGGFDPQNPKPMAVSQLTSTIATWMYFAVTEGLFGASAGKWLLQVRVRREGGVGAPGLLLGSWRSGCWIILHGLPAALLPVLTPWETQAQIVQMGILAGVLNLVGLALMLSTIRKRNGFAFLHDVLSRTRVVQVAAERAITRFPPHSTRLEGRESAEARTLGTFQVLGTVRRQGNERVLRAVDAGLDRAVWVWERPLAEPELPAARCEAHSGTLLRWLAHGEQEGNRWDAFLVPPGSPLPEAVAVTGAVAWEQVREMLAQLADGLIRSGDEAAVVERFSLGQVWVTPEGRVMLIDLPITEDRPLADDDLMAQAASLLLEGPNGLGGPVAHADDWTGPAVPLPGYARELFRERPRVPEVRRRLAETQDKPTRVSRPMRILSLALLGLAFLLSCSVPIWPAFMGLPVAGILQARLADARHARTELARYEVVFAVDIASPRPQPLTRALPMLQFNQMHQQRQRLDAVLRERQAYRNARLQRLAPMYREMFGQEKLGNVTRNRPFFHDLVFQTQSVTEDLRQPPGMTRALGPLSFAMVGVPVLLVVFSAFVFRGGLRHRVLRLELVRRDGQPAGRFRCAWRTLMASVPCVAPLALARWLEEEYWLRWTPESAPVWMLATADACWIAAIVVPLVWVGMALYTPARSVHDRLAGTWLVPR